MKRFLLLLSLAGSLLMAQTSVTVKNLTMSVDATAAVNAWMVTQVTNFPTATNGAIDAAATAVNVADGSVMSASDVLVIHGEALQIVGKVNKVLTVTRAAFGTVAASHADKTTVQVMRYKTYALLFQEFISAQVKSIMDQSSYPTAATQNAIINTAKAAKDAAKAGAIQ